MERTDLGCEIETALGEVLAHVRGETGLSCRIVDDPAASRIVALRKRLRLSRQKFADRFGLDVRAVQEWEQGRRVPDRAARVLLTVIDRDPEAVWSGHWARMAAMGGRVIPARCEQRAGRRFVGRKWTLPEAAGPCSNDQQQASSSAYAVSGRFGSRLSPVPVALLVVGPPRHRWRAADRRRPADTEGAGRGCQRRRALGQPGGA